MSTFRTHYPYLNTYTHSSPWGTTLGLFQTADLNLINLETSATTTNEPWPDKAFNYRMHPVNLGVLRAGRVDFAALANNHTLDFGTEGLVETVWGVRGVGVRFAGVGEGTDESRRAAVLELPRVSASSSLRAGGRGEREEEGRRKWSEREKHGCHGHERVSDAVQGADGIGISIRDLQQVQRHHHKIHVYSASDHPRDWAVVPTFHLIDYSSSTRRHLKTLLTSPSPFTSSESHTSNITSRGAASTSTSTASSPTSGTPKEIKSEHPALKIFSIHWGPNYAWQPAPQIRSLAHFLIDECGVDIVHGHSAHHVQGVERYNGKLIMYGCGDFVDDYALNVRFRNDLGAVWRVVVREVERSSSRSDGSGGELGLELDRLEIFPTRCDRFQVTLLDTDDEDHGWVRTKITALSEEMGTKVNRILGEAGQVVVDLQ